MAIEIEKETLEQDRFGKLRIRRRYLADTRTEALTGLPRTVEGLPLVGTRSTPWVSKNDGRYVVDASYEGLIEDPDEAFDEYDLITEERETKIESFRPFDVLFEDFGAYTDLQTRQVMFPEYLPKPKSRLGQPLTLNNRGSEAETPNPLFGAKTFPLPHTTAVWRLVRKRVPTSLTRQEGTVIDRLPSGFDYSGPKKQWYVRPLQKRKSGNAWQIEWSAMQVTGFPDLEVLLALKEAQTR